MTTRDQSTTGLPRTALRLPRRRTLPAIALVCVAAASFRPQPALATFGCTIGDTPVGHAVLYSTPDPSSKAIRNLPDGTMVSLLDDVPAPATGEWAAVSHAPDGNPTWGAGDRGWVLSRYLTDCG